MNKPASPMLIMRIIWWSLLISIIFYFFIIQFRAESMSSASELVLPITICATIASFLGFLLGNFLFKAAIKNLPQDTPKEKILRTFLVSFIIRMALFETVACYGLILGFLGSKNQSHYFFIAAVILFLQEFPNEQKILKKANSLKKFNELK